FFPRLAHDGLFSFGERVVGVRPGQDTRNLTMVDRGRRFHFAPDTSPMRNLLRHRPRGGLSRRDSGFVHVCRQSRRLAAPGHDFIVVRRYIRFPEPGGPPQTLWDNRTSQIRLLHHFDDFSSPTVPKAPGDLIDVCRLTMSSLKPIAVGSPGVWSSSYSSTRSTFPTRNTYDSTPMMVIAAM